VPKLLRELGVLARRATNGELLRKPLVTLCLKSTAQLRGTILEVSEEDGAHTVLLHVPGDDRFPRWDVAHVPVDAVEAVIVHDVVSLARPADALPGPTRVELKKTLGALESELSTHVGASIAFELYGEVHEEALEPLGTVAPMVAKVLQHAAEHDQSRTTVQARVHRVRLLVGREARVALEGDALVVVTTQDAPRRMTPQALARAVEAVL